jgi:diguanylate cyclase
VLIPRRLRTKLTLLYAGLFSAALLLVGVISYAVIAGNAQRLGREQLAATGVVFDRVWQLRFEQLRDGARLASRDYGFREAVATDDPATTASALANLRGRLRADLVYLITPNGLLLDADGGAASASAGLQAALNEQEEPIGVLTAHEELYQAVAMPVFAPHMLGWIVVGARLDNGEMRALEQLSALPLHAEVLDRSAVRALAPAAMAGEAVTDDALRMFSEGDAIVLVKPLHSLDSTHSALVLRYPLANALAPYRALFNSLVAIGIAMLALLLVGTWLLANGITKPLSSLAEAAQKLRQGRYEPVRIDTKDELSHVADSFNAMVDALRDRERKIMHLAFHDGETGLPNRLALERRLAAAPAQSVFIAAVGIDRFAQIRAAIGYAHTEALVRRLGARLARLIPGSASARLSSEVLAIAFRAQSEDDAHRRASALLMHLERPLELEGQAIDVTVTIGIAAPRAKEEGAAHIKRASIALDQARTARSKIATFDEAAYGNPALNLSLMGEMRRAFEDGAIFLVHQPKFSFRARRVESVETLIRWRHPTRGDIAPDLFVRMAEETGHIRALTDWVLRKAIEEQRALAAAGWPLAFAVNISGRVLGDPEFAQSALEAASRAVQPLRFEITETAVIDNPAVALTNIELFAQHGVSIAIDDYGSGLSSLAYLRQLPAHELKIDRMFVQNITNSQRDALLVRSTIDLAHGLGLEVTAEGVEHPAAFALLAGMGCDTAQGYLIARPAPLGDLIGALENIERMDLFKTAARPAEPTQAA